ncbi:hypothetical protein TSUD_372430 [Trifolium subterraneum]|uniref:Retrotransposon gag domain-containing protein n=1 Tax=Trifolium subterraneum TaxID=3900 RepID=A0A2Z6MYC6_TRISU|nr:hypothetical protein TSUD_372430 [Trifolium subterraneum]
MTSARANAQIAKSLATLTHLLARGDDPARDGEKRLDRFLKHKSSFFVGGFNPDGVIKWVEEVEIIFDAMECANENKLALGTYVLREEANQWWKNAKLRLGDRGVVITLEMFKREFCNKYFPADVKNKKVVEIMKLEQGNMSVAEYAAKFESLCAFSPHYNTPETENDKCVKFESGLRPDIKHIIGFAEIRNFTTLVLSFSRLWLKKFLSRILEPLVTSLFGFSSPVSDVAFAVNKLSQQMQAPTTTHMQALKRVLRYLKSTISHGLHLVKTTNLNVTAFCDADWGGDTIDRKSTGAYIVYLGPNVISWSCKKQSTVARSSTEDEYRTIATTTAEILWLRQLLHELGLDLNQPPTIFSDNIGATYLCANPVFHSRMKHLAIDYHFVRDLVAANQLQVSHVPSSHQLADLLTKPSFFPTSQFSNVQDWSH